MLPRGADLGANLIECEGAAALAEALEGNTHLRSLGLYASFIKATGARALARVDGGAAVLEALAARRAVRVAPAGGADGAIVGRLVALGD